MSRRLNRVPLSDQDGVNMTPMLDMVFILLIFFIVTAVFLDEHGVVIGIFPTCARLDLKRRSCGLLRH